MRNEGALEAGLLTCSNPVRTRAMKARYIALIASLWVLAVTASTSPVNRERLARQPLIVLSKEIGPLKQAFNRDADRTRLLLLLSPT
jgi:hypothetical protein